MKLVFNKKIIITFLAVIAGFSFVRGVSRGNDQIAFLSPSENQTIVGTQSIQWIAVDSDQSNILFQLDLFNDTCANNGEFYATVTDNSSDFSKLSGNNYSYQWDSSGPLKTMAGTDDGPYCLRVCGKFVQDTNYYYALCDTRSIDVQNKDQKPQILSTPENTTIKVGTIFNYQINAHDPDEDTITYSLTKGPSFIIVNSSTGLVTSTAAVSQPGSYIVTVRAQDPYGAYAEQTFTINVTSSAAAAQVDVISPVVNEIVKGSNYNIIWSITNNTQVVGYTISLSKDVSSWTKIAQVTTPATNYNWSLSSVENGDYYIKIDATLADSNIVSTISGKFSVNNNGNEIPLINSVHPAEESTITDNRPIISANFTIANGMVLNKNQTGISLNDSTLGDCIKTDNSISCVPSQNLAAGRYKAKVEVVDSGKQTGVKEWYFDITDNSASNQTSNVDYIKLLENVGVYVCAGALAIAVIFIIFKFLGKIKRNQNNDNYVGSAPAQPTFTTTTTSIPQPTNQIPSFVSNSGYSNQGSSTVSSSDQPYQIDTYPMNPWDGKVNQAAVQTAAAQPTSGAQTNEIHLDQSDQISMPSSYTTDEIPDWLKSMDSDKPMGESGNERSDLENQPGQNMDQISEPHE